MYWKKIGGRNTQNNYIVRTPQSTIDIGQITNHLGSELSTNKFDSGMNINNAVSIIKKSTSECNPNRLNEPAELTIWNGTVDNSGNGIGEKIDSFHIYHGDIESVSNINVFNVGINNGIDSYSGEKNTNLALVGINNASPYFELDVNGASRVNSSRIGIGTHSNNEPYDIIGKEIYAGSTLNNLGSIWPQYQPLLNYYGGGTIHITGFIYAIDDDENGTIDILLQSKKTFSSDETTNNYVMTNKSSTNINKYMNINVYLLENITPSYHVDIMVMDKYIITKLNFECPYRFAVNSEEERLFYEYSTGNSYVFTQPFSDPSATIIAESGASQ